MSRELLVNRRLNPLLSSLPAWVEEFRPHQIEAVDQIMRAFGRGVRCVVLDAPTGSGKTLIGETVRRMMKARACYVCSDKGLQSQFIRDFPYGVRLMGRNNYPTVNFPDDFHPGDWLGHISAEDCTWTEKAPCSLCPEKRSCPYELEKARALHSDLAVLNTPYFLTESNGPGRFAGRDLVVVDEADLLESSLMGWVSVEVSQRRLERYGWSPPKLTVEADWLRWAREKRPQVRQFQSKLTAKAELSVAEAKELKYLSSLAKALRRISTDLESGNSPWVYDGDRERVSFKPSKVVAFGEEALWSHGKRWLLMSASVISADEMMFSLGFREGEWEQVRMGSTFAPSQRKVHVRPVANMTRKAMGRDNGTLVGELRRIVFLHPNDRILVHTVSYDLTGKIAGALRSLFPNRHVYAYTTAHTRAIALAKYKGTDAAILCGPSLDRGVDLPGDLCRVQVICKTPFPYLGDKVVAARYHSGQEGRVWYTVQTVRTVVQMTGRAVRNSEDYADTYILDSGFVDQLWSRGGRRLFPEWWTEGLVWEKVK